MVRGKKKKGEISAFMGPGSEFEGRLHFSGAVRLDGRIVGSIESEGLLVIGPGGVIEADVEVDTAIVSGQVRGDITAATRIELRPPAKVYGTLSAPSVIIQDGVVFEGACRMTDGPREKPEAEGGKVAFLIADKAS